MPIVSYEGGNRTEEMLNFPNTGATGPVSSPVGDVEKRAVPFNRNAYQHLTPTLSKFTLPDKVAIITG